MSQNPADESQSKQPIPKQTVTENPSRAVPPRPPKKRGGKRTVFLLLVVFGLVISVFLNLWFYAGYQKYYSPGAKAVEQFHSGNAIASDKIAIIRLQGTIMPPVTERLLAQIEQAQKDDAVKGVLLAIDSPGGLVADSHQIYHQLQELRREKKKPVYVAMKRLAASGGYYIAMGAGPEGKIFAEPTTWTGSIGVIIPRYDISGLAENWNIKSVPLKTGRFKDALSPFRELTQAEKDVWKEILNESFLKFLTVIDENREQLVIRETKEPTAADDPEVVENHWELVSTSAADDEKMNLATGRIFTASSAVKHGLIDEIGFEEDALKQLQEKLGLEEVRVVTYYTPVTLWETLIGWGKAQAPEQQRQMRFDSAVPQALYYFSWVPPALPFE